MKVVVAGAGAFGKKHLDGSKNIDGAGVVALVGRRLEPTQQTAMYDDRTEQDLQTKDDEHGITRREFGALSTGAAMSVVLPLFSVPTSIAGFAPVDSGALITRRVQFL